MNGILKNCVVIDLTQFNYQNLGRALEAANLSNINVEFLASSKKDGFAKLFIDKETANILAFTTKESRNDIMLTSTFADALQSMACVKIVKKIDISTEKFDMILEKISKNGISSLSKKERDYLDTYSQSQSK